ncbi:CLUMA_CG008368, isoform A [Clunio marinus]|uniref:CLUMA_CG008368, isoform A n=1 Tax=Clunio marinus TaxID=568069 RepID=A0A1J1I5K9_9DIPT|nr:CLUMA_CG008368, isoform A [Clunio marinus]
MDSSQNCSITPRRSRRLRKNENSSSPKTPPVEEVEKKVRGPRSMAKLNRSKQVLERTVSEPLTLMNDQRTENSLSSISIIKDGSLRATNSEDFHTKTEESLEKISDVSTESTSSSRGKKNKVAKQKRGKKRKQNESSSFEKSQEQQLESTIEMSENSSLFRDNTIIEMNPLTEEADEGKLDEKRPLTPVVEVPEFSVAPTHPSDENVIEKTSEATGEVKAVETSLIKVPEIKVSDDVFTNSEEKKDVETAEQKISVKEEKIEEVFQLSPNSKKKMNETPQLMDESIISVPESPPPTSPTQKKDATFSPVVDTSINDSRPIIDDFITAPNPVKNVALRTSTPLGNKSKSIATRSSTPSARLLSKIISTKFKDEKTVNESVNKQLKVPSDPLEKSILKSSRRKRSMSVADSESFMQKRVMFNSPQFMEIGTIDEKMIASFIEEKENSMMIKAANSSRRKRSMSTGTPAKVLERQVTRVKMPNFKAIHEQQFQKMESIADHAKRREERAKKLVTPTPDHKILKSKIPTFNNRKALTGTLSSENMSMFPSRTLKRSLSANADEPIKKKTLMNMKHTIEKNAGSSTSLCKSVAVVRGFQRSNSENVKTTTSAAANVTISYFSEKKKETENGSNSTEMNRKKVEERQERNMSLYKSRNQVQQTSIDQRKKRQNMLVGVRLNRRFELQMQHRLEHENK